MGNMKNIAMTVSDMMGFGGILNDLVFEVSENIVNGYTKIARLSSRMGFKYEINTTVLKIYDRIEANRKETNPQKKALESLSIEARIKYYKQNEILYAEGAMARCQCSQCLYIYNYKNGSGITHGLCQECYDRAIKQLDDVKNEMADEEYDAMLVSGEIF